MKMLEKKIPRTRKKEVVERDNDVSNSSSMSVSAPVIPPRPYKLCMSSVFWCKLLVFKLNTWILAAHQILALTGINLQTKSVIVSCFSLFIRKFIEKLSLCFRALLSWLYCLKKSFDFSTWMSNNVGYTESLSMILRSCSICILIQHRTFAMIARKCPLILPSQTCIFMLVKYP